MEKIMKRKASGTVGQITAYVKANTKRLPVDKQTKLRIKQLTNEKLRIIKEIKSNPKLANTELHARYKEINGELILLKTNDSTFRNQSENKVGIVLKKAETTDATAPEMDVANTSESAPAKELPINLLNAQIEAISEPVSESYMADNRVSRPSVIGSTRATETIEINETIQEVIVTDTSTPVQYGESLNDHFFDDPEISKKKVYEKHAYNFLPPMTAKEFEGLLGMIRNGYDKNKPITLFEGKILDGWHRNLACIQLNREPTYFIFTGTAIEAINHVLESETRRSIKSSQGAALAAMAEEITSKIRQDVEEARRKKQSETLKKKSGQDIVSDKKLSDTSSTHLSGESCGKLFCTDRTYINQAKNLKISDPELFDKVLNGNLNLSKAKKIQEQKAFEKTHIEVMPVTTKNYKLFYVCLSAEQLKEKLTDSEILEKVNFLDISLMIEEKAASTLFLQFNPDIEFAATKLISKWGFKIVERNVVTHNHSIINSIYFQQEHDFLYVCVKNEGVVITPLESQRGSILKDSEIFISIDELYPENTSKLSVFAEYNGWDTCNWDSSSNKFVVLPSYHSVL
jgi:hypothetical protein